MEIQYYQSIPELGIKGTFDTREQFKNIGLPQDLTGKTVLDIGSNMGAFCFEAVKRGAFHVMGAEKNRDWRIISQGIAKELGYDVTFYEDYTSAPKVDITLLLSVTHVWEGEAPQKLIDWAWEHTKNLMIVEVNDRLQKEEITLPSSARVYGTNKDNRTVYHCPKI